MPPGTIYVITNTVNGKQYVGQTIKTITQRWSEHCSQASAPRRARTALPAAIRKYGADVFTIEAIYELIATSMQPDLDAAEAIFIELFQTMAPDGYNLVHGGRGGARSAEAREHMSLAKQNQSQETRAKISANRRGKIHSPDARARMSASQRRRFERDGVSSATRQRLSVASKNRIRTPEHGARISAALKGRPRSPETVAKMKATKTARRGTYKKRVVSAETRKRISLARIGIQFSADTREKMSAARRGKPWSPTRREAARRRAYTHSVDALAKMSAALKGKPWSAARRAAHENSRRAAGTDPVQEHLWDVA